MTTPADIADRLLDSTLDFIINAPDDEFRAYLADTNENAEELSRVASAGIASALKRHGEQKRAAAKAEYSAARAAYERERSTLPRTLAEKVAMIARLLSESSAAGLRPSLQHRDLSSMPEEELDRILLQLIHLTKNH